MNLDQIREKHNLALIILHGSQITGKTHSESDFDVAVIRNAGKSFDLLDLILDLKIYFKTDKIDLTDITHADPLLLFSIVTRGKLVSGSTIQFDSLERTAFFKYADYIPYLDMEREMVAKKINNYAKN